MESRREFVVYVYRVGFYRIWVIFIVIWGLSLNEVYFIGWSRRGIFGFIFRLKVLNLGFFLGKL